jgi:hypothetical protein
MASREAPTTRDPTTTCRGSQREKSQGADGKKKKDAASAKFQNAGYSAWTGKKKTEQEEQMIPPAQPRDHKPMLLEPLLGSQCRRRRSALVGPAERFRTEQAAHAIVCSRRRVRHTPPALCRSCSAMDSGIKHQPCFSEHDAPAGRNQKAASGALSLMSKNKKEYLGCTVSNH